MLRCWLLVRILVRTDDPCLGVGCHNSQSTNKVAALTAYIMARGLCHYCAEKWVKGHKCAATISLHAIQELWEMVSTDSGSDRGTYEAGTVD
jgi:hypothetical protein